MSTACDRDQVLALATGELDGDQSLAVLQHVETCADCSRELDFLADVSATAAVAPRPRPNRAALVAGLAAAALFWLAATWWHGGEGSTDTWKALPPPAWIDVELRADGDALRQDFARAMQPYAEGRWSRAVAALDELLASHPDHEPARFYLAVARGELGQLDEAATGYRRVAAARQDALAAHALWRLAHVAWQLGEAAEARAALEELVTRASGYAHQARALLEREIPAP